MKIESYNEFDPLKSVVVGRADFANFPQYDRLFQIQMSQAGWTETPPPSGPVPQHVIDETNEDLDILADTLCDMGINVYRPDVYDWQTIDAQYSYCPRDNALVLGSRVIEAPMSTKGRQQEAQMFTSIRRAAIEDGARWISAPHPNLVEDENLVEGKFQLNELEPVFDAANICRFGRNLLYLVSNSGNRAGALWLQNVLGSDYNVHVTDCYDSAHIDSTIVPVEYHKVVLNASRVKESDLPWFIEDWDKIWITEDMINPQSFIGYPYASKWIAINMLALGNNKVVCDKNQPKIIAELEKHGMEVIPLELRHSRTLGGGFHCVTLDLERSIFY